MKQKYYRLDSINKIKAAYNILLGERSNGKSYAVKEYAVMRAWESDEQRFIMLRRWETDIKPSLVEQYFADCPISVITKNKCDGVSVYRGAIYLTKHNDETNKDEKIKKIGYTCALSLEQRYKSASFLDVDKVIFEEFIATTFYLPNEPLSLMNFISTVARRRLIQVYMIGNTISRVCPYFSEWQLVNIPKQQQGTIEVYKYATDEYDEAGEKIVVTIAVEFCENSARNSKMFFGASSNMITTGAWQSREMPHLRGNKLQDYSLLHTIIFKVNDFLFKAEFLQENDTGILLWFISPKTTPIKPDDRVITDKNVLYNSITTIGLIPLSQQEGVALSYLNEGKIFYSDNLTGTDFENCLHLLKKG